MNRLNLLVQSIVIWILKLFHKEDDEKLAETLIQFVKFCLVGVTNTALSYILNIAVLKLLQPYSLSWDFIVANVISFVISVAWSFYWNNKYVFTQQEGQKRNIWKALLKAYLSYGFTGVILTNVLSYIWIDMLGISKYFAPLINLVISVPINFLINKLWAFKTNKIDVSEEE